ncbi:hypothetical protein [Halomonas sp.]|uniref:ImmA/IrrE family metallo-endopeptidase n=1 Tax=Halomonas sp. TaxID=1486246 RepID=UPI0025C6DA3B|nr:hypothetical protein [Halomonas sp.]
MSFRMTTRWCKVSSLTSGSAQAHQPDQATLAELELAVGELLFTRAEDSLSGEVRHHAVLAANPLAEWLVWNWWRLCFEPQPAGKQAPGWLEAHRMANVGGGWLWPNVEFVSDGVRMRIGAKASAASAHQPVRYLSADHAVIPLAHFVQGVDAFVERVIERLSSQAVAGADLPHMYQELLAERADPEAATYRRLEALLGFDPDECPDDRVMTLYQDAQGLGLEAIAELAAGAGSSPLSASQLKRWARSQGCESDKQNRLGWVGQGYRVDHQLPAWRNGVKAAHALRAQERLTDAAIGNRQLAEWFAVPPGLFEEQRHNKALAYELAFESDKSRVLLRSRWQAGRRFEVARLLGDVLLQAEPEPLHLATAQNTYRQKLQRAFAAELLCPIEALSELLAGDFSDDAIQGAADTFGVSPMTVTVQLLNNRVMQSDELNGLDPDWAVA